MKYDISKQFGIYRYFKPPFGKATLNLWGKLIAKSYKVLEKEKEIEYSKFSVQGLKLYFIKPKNRENVPCLLFLHGGAFTFPAYKSHYKVGLEYSKGADVAVLFVDYRLAPDNPFGAAENDCKNALDWLYENAEMLSVDINRIGIVGDSAGGNLAAKTSEYAAKKGYKIKCQAFIYPVVDPYSETESKKTFTDTPMWNAALNEKMWFYYFGGKTASEVGYKKILSDDFKISDCPSLVEVCEYDCLKDEGLILASYLLRRGVDVESYTIKKAMHGFDVKDCEISKKAIKKRVEFFRRALNDYS